jgi:hypothetical protein
MASAMTDRPNPGITTHTDHDTAMLQQHTLDQLRGLRLDGMVAALADTGMQAAAEHLPFEQRLALLVQRGWTGATASAWRGCSKPPSSRSAVPAWRTSTGVPAAGWTAT